MHPNCCNMNFLAKQSHFKLGTEMLFVMRKMCFLVSNGKSDDQAKEEIFTKANR